MANYYLRSCGQSIKATTMRLPLELAEFSVATYGFSGHLYRRSVIKCSMYTVRVVILAKINQLSLQVTGIPEDRLFKEFLTNGPDQSFDEGMR